jgi:hypothetical protein
MNQPYTGLNVSPLDDNEAIKTTGARCIPGGVYPAATYAWELTSN